MITATVKELKEELSNHTQKELVELCLGLAKFKKENKELLTYLLYESDNEDAFIAGVKKEMDSMFNEVNTKSVYLVKKSVRKILRIAKKYIRYSRKKETDAALRIYYCSLLKKMRPSITASPSLMKIYNREIAAIKATVDSLHEDLQYDYIRELEALEKIN